METPIGHIQQLALAEVVERRKDDSGLLKPIEYSVVNSLLLAPSFGGIYYTDIDFGFPDIDSVMTPFSNTSGSFDETAFHRERAISLTLKVVDGWFPQVGAENWSHPEWNSSSFWIRELGRWTVPNKRFCLFWKNTGADATTYWTDIRGAGMTNSIAMAERETRNVQLNFISASGKIYLFNEASYPQASKDGRTRNVFQFGGVTNPGINLPLTFPFSFPTSSSSNTGGVNYRGMISTGFTTRVWAGAGAATVDPRMTVTAPDDSVTSIGFSGLTIPAGQFVEIDTNRMTVLMNGIPTERRENVLTAPLQFPQLQPGLNRVGFTATSAGADSYLETLHFDAFLA